jgi:hypothetical protein
MKAPARYGVRTGSRFVSLASKRQTSKVLNLVVDPKHAG